MATGFSSRTRKGRREENEVILQYLFAYIIEDISSILNMRNRRLLYAEYILYPLETNVQVSQFQTWV